MPQHMERVEQRLRVLEQIVTDGGAQTAAQIEALRDQERIESGDKCNESRSSSSSLILIVVIVMFTSIVRAQDGHRRRGQCGNARAILRLRRRTLRLRDEVRQLKERIKVLERITVEKENSLAKEIKSLRDR